MAAENKSIKKLRIFKKQCELHIETCEIDGRETSLFRKAAYLTERLEELVKHLEDFPLLLTVDLDRYCYQCVFTLEYKGADGPQYTLKVHAEVGWALVSMPIAAGLSMEHIIANLEDINIGDIPNGHTSLTLISNIGSSSSPKKLAWLHLTICNSDGTLKGIDGRL